MRKVIFFGAGYLYAEEGDFELAGCVMMKLRQIGEEYLYGGEGEFIW